MRFYTLTLLLGMLFITHSALAKDSDKMHAKHSHASKANKQTKKSKKKKSSIMSCRTAYTTARGSRFPNEAEDAAEICENATQKACAKNSNGTGDGRYVTALCFLNAAHKANLAVNEHQGARKCEAAYKESQGSPSTLDLSNAADICTEERNEICRKMNDGSGDGRLAATNCQLTAAHGGFIGVTVKERPRPRADANLCDEKAAPRICKGNCYVNYECSNGKWQVSPIESCAICDGAADSIDVIEGESKADSAE